MYSFFDGGGGVQENFRGAPSRNLPLFISKSILIQYFAHHMYSVPIMFRTKQPIFENISKLHIIYMY